MDLALELGMPVGLLKRAMSEREFGTWLAYARVRKLPHQRLELYLARLSMLLVAVFGGAQNKTLADFVLDFDSSNNETQDEEDLADVFQFRPKVKKNGP